MVQKSYLNRMISQSCTKNLFDPLNSPALEYPNTSIYICWERLIAKRALVLSTIDEMPPYLLMPEVMELLHAEKNPTYRLIMDLMWSTGGRISEILALTPSSFNNDGYDFGVIHKTLKRTSGRPTKASLLRSSKRYVPIKDKVLQDRILSFIYAGHFTKTQRLFPMSRQTVNRHIKAVVERVGGAWFSISSHTFRHSFAIHLLLHGVPLKIISKLLGHRSIKSTEIYTNVLTIDGGHFLEKVDFH